MHAIRVNDLGGPDVMKYEELPAPTPSAGQALVRIKAVGVNFIDVYYRIGHYKAQLPFTPGVEAAGVVEALGSDVRELKVGDRVAYAMQIGSYAEFAVVAADRLVKIPQDLDDRHAAAALLQGMTAHYLSRDAYAIKPGDTVLIHAAAGGVGLLLTQVARRLGARIIATVSTEGKAKLARDAGAHEVILYTQQDFEEEVRRLTAGEGVHVVYDSVGKTTFEKSLNCLRRRGFMVLFGASSGPPGPMDPARLAKGSLFLTRPGLADYATERSELLSRASAVFDWVVRGELRVRVEHDYPLAQAPQAHRDLEGRKTTGKVVLVPA